MKLHYKLKQDIVARIASNLAWELGQMKSSVRISCEKRDINGKSLVGLLTGYFRFGEEITVTFDEEKYLEQIKDLFKEIGDEI